MALATRPPPGAGAVQWARHLRLRSRVLLALLWLVLPLWAEHWAPQREAHQCAWPPAPSGQPGAQHVSLVADPQIIDAWSYPGRIAPLQWVTRVLTDRWEARSWRFLSYLRPHKTFFLGDLFDGGREWAVGDPRWMEERQRLARIFPPPATGDVVWSVQGNHDIGFGTDIVPGAPERFAEQFGPANQVYPLLSGAYDMVILDTLSLSSENRTLSHEVEAQRFLDTFSPTQAGSRVILLTHVPLYRPENASCGPERESGRPLPQADGYQYQTQLSFNLTEEIVHKLNPALIFSGDDHDACLYTHPPSAVPPPDPLEPNRTVGWRAFGGATEHTIKSFSMAMGISRPGLDLLSLDSQGWAVASCYFGSPYKPYVAYGLVALACLVVMGVLRHPGRVPVPGGLANPTLRPSWAWGKSSAASEILPMHAPHARATSTARTADEASDALLPRAGPSNGAWDSEPSSPPPGPVMAWILSWTQIAPQDARRLGITIGVDAVVCATAWLTGEVLVDRWSYLPMA